ncbi:MAG: PAS domain S-box protein, partial [Dehalococcoidia bacterium]
MARAQASARRHPGEDMMPEHTPQETFSQSESRFRALFEQSMDAIYIVAPDGKSLEANQAWLDMFGYSREDLSTLRAEAVYANPADRANFLRLVSDTGFVKDEERFRRKDGTEFDCERTVVAIADDSGALIAYQGVYRD